ncbi:MAG: phosphatase PAP2 family protein [Ferruginibacter sp.]
MESLLEWDRSLFKVINSQWHNPVFDAVFPYLRIAEFWAPFYFFLILFAILNFKSSGWKWVAFCIITATLTNIVSSDLIKQNIIRLRPCNDPANADWIRILVNYRPQSSSFTSSHAANHFGIAMFSYITFRRFFPGWSKLFFVWAAAICYAQMYVGVHYPLDILGGTLVGIIIGYITGTVYNRRWGLQWNTAAILEY